MLSWFTQMVFATRLLPLRLLYAPWRSLASRNSVGANARKAPHLPFREDAGSAPEPSAAVPEAASWDRGPALTSELVPRRARPKKPYEESEQRAYEHVSM